MPVLSIIFKTLEPAVMKKVSWFQLGRETVLCKVLLILDHVEVPKEHSLPKVSARYYLVLPQNGVYKDKLLEGFVYWSGPTDEVGHQGYCKYYSAEGIEENITRLRDLVKVLTECQAKMP